MCSKKEYGGFGVRQFKEFNFAILDKWCWRMLVHRGGLWQGSSCPLWRSRLEVGARVVLLGGGRSGESRKELAVLVVVGLRRVYRGR